MRMTARTSTSAQMNDLIKRPISISSEIVKALGNASQPCKVIASRVMAARAILKAAEGSGTHLEQVLDRTEGKVASQESTGGATINFNFVVQGDQGVRQVGELVTGVLENAAINKGMCRDVDGVPDSAQLNPTSRSTPTINPTLSLPASDDQDAESK